MGRFHRHEDGTDHLHDESHDDPDDDDPDDGDHNDPHDLHDPHDRDHGDLGDLSAYRTGRERVVVLERIFGENDRCADEPARGWMPPGSLR